LNKIDKESSRFFGILNQLGESFDPILSGVLYADSYKISVREITAHGNINEKNGGKNRKNSQKNHLWLQKWQWFNLQCRFTRKAPGTFWIRCLQG